MTSWFGYLAVKCPLDLWVYQELLVRHRPDLIVECGTSFGGSALFLATMCELLDHGRILSIDIDASKAEIRPRHPRIQYLAGSSTDPDIVGEAVRQAAMVDRVMVILDSDHTQTHVAGELDAYHGLVRKGGYLIVEDTNVNGHPTEPGFGPGPMEALDAFLAQHPEFVIDSACERFLMTCNPRGYLVRVA
ncbi:MAG: class I SAM-dependent methyltransferase [Alphaproteobacteria bacterium]|nr:class I SAM-dependent methyltransferase [Alphaproteobacteria bacterium]